MNLNLKNKTAVVCGSTQGIGKASALELAELGANVVLLARNEETLKSTLNELANNGSQNHSYLVADFSKTEEVKNVINDWASRNEAQILVNNTGGPPSGPIAEASEEELLSGFNNHIINNQNLVKALLSGMKNSSFGRIINVISTSVKIPIQGLGVSNTIRGAVANWAKTLSLELAPFGITVNNVLPGFTDTGRLQSLFEGKAKKLGFTAEQVKNDSLKSIPAGRLGDPHEVAAAVAFLATPAAAYINGINVPVDGGRTGSL